MHSCAKGVSTLCAHLFQMHTSKPEGRSQTTVLNLVVYNAHVHVHVHDGTYRVILKIVKAGCHPVAIAHVIQH